MTLTRRTTAAWAMLGFLANLAAPELAHAQPLGTFRWQLAPYCNVLTLHIVQEDGRFALRGTDDQCGASRLASVVGLAFPNPDGSIGFGLTVVTAPGGTPVHIDATISVATVSGTWRDSAANSGTFAFSPGPGSGGPSRPVPTGGLPAGSVTSAQLAPGAVGAGQLAPDAVTGASVVDGSLTSADLADGPRAAFVSGPWVIQLPGPAGPSAPDTVMASVTVTAPAAGTVLATASGFFWLDSSSTDQARCSLSETATQNADVIVEDFSPNLYAHIPFSTTKGFSVPAGDFTVNFVCRLQYGAVIVSTSNLTALFVPQ